MYLMRAIGGSIYFVGVCMMVWNLYKTARQGKLIANQAAEAPARQKIVRVKGEYWHNWLERKPVQFLVLTLIAVLIGGIVEIFPMLLIKNNIPTIASVQPYTPLEIEGRDIYIREGCIGCHSQMVRPFRSETVRYGDYSKSGEFIYDRPFLWGSKRTGPDLHRVGGKYSHKWHYDHMEDPENTSAGSIMPRYPWLYKKDINTEYTVAKIKTLRTLNTPYQAGYEQIAVADLRAQAKQIADELREQGVKQENLENKEIVALIAYLQRLGTDIKKQDQ